MRAAPLMDTGRRMSALTPGEVVVLPWPSDRPRESFANAIHKMALRRRKLGLSVRVRAAATGMEVKCFTGMTRPGREFGPLRIRLMAMQRAEVLTVPAEDVARVYRQFARTRSTVQDYTGRVYRVRKAPGAVIVERRA